MRGSRASAGLLLATAVVVAAALACSAQVPERMNYQVMLTDGADQPIAGQTVSVVFRIYDQESGGTVLWTEPQTVTTNSIGVASVILGSVSALDIDFAGPRWLEVEVEGEILAPRRELVASPYARQAQNSANLGGEPAASYALSGPLSAPGTINDSGNPVDWTELKNVPAGFADGTDDTGAGAGDGYSLDASDGDPVDVVYVEGTGNVLVNGTTPWAAAMEVTADRDSMGVYVFSNNSDATAVALVAVSDSTTGLVGNSYESAQSYTVPLNPAGVGGIGSGPADGGFFGANGSGDGIECRSAGLGSALHAEGGLGYSGHFLDGAGVSIERAGGIPVLYVDNTSTTGWGDAARFYSESGVASNTWTIYSECYEGNTARFEKNTDDNEYAVTIYGANASAEGLYVGGSIFTTAPAARGVETSRGEEAVFGVTSADVSVIASGTGVLSGGAARVEFDRLFAESVSGDADLRVTVTPIGAWSALYIERIDDGGFDIKSGAGEKNVEFHWMAVGRAKGYQERPRISMPDPSVDEAIAREKAESLAAQRASLPTRQGGSGTVTIER